jgi:hypothetical protein
MFKWMPRWRRRTLEPQPESERDEKQKASPSGTAPGLQEIRRWLQRAARTVEEVADGGFAVATPPPGSDSTEIGDRERETSTNAQVQGAVGQPWPGNR